MNLTLSMNWKEKQPFAQKNGRVLKHVLVSLLMEGAPISKNLSLSAFVLAEVFAAEPFQSN